MIVAMSFIMWLPIAWLALGIIPIDLMPVLDERRADQNDPGCGDATIEQGCHPPSLPHVAPSG